ncbi:uncharacterized protein [Gossypium hirsutum]|uniref:Uncharacterized protein isoform X2 n=3 Tax=Gossypium TaxID=3633 RepID=A0A1U8LTQ4_GOSHI|nr:uncharacterized protein LOC107929626 isoform X2 [Gossypium hirsutum]
MAQEAGVFPKSLKSYVQRELALCKDENQSTACQEIMKEVRLQLVFFPAPFIRFGSLSHLECGSCYYSLDQRRRSNNLVSCHYIFHNWGPWWLRNVVSPSLSCYEGCMGHGC